MGKGLSRKEYNKRYYELKKEEINKRRKRKYHLDKDYREKCKRISKESYKKRTKGMDKVDRRIVKIGDDYFYTSGYFKDVIGREPATIRTLQRKGVIPEVTNVNEHGWRLYTENQKDLIIEMFQAYDAGQIKNLKEYADYLKENWKG